MKNLLLAAAAATLVVAVSPAFAESPAELAEQGYAGSSPGEGRDLSAPTLERWKILFNIQSEYGELFLTN